VKSKLQNGQEMYKYIWSVNRIKQNTLLFLVFAVEIAVFKGKIS